MATDPHVFALQQQVETLQGIIDGYSQQGLDTLLQQRAFSAGSSADGYVQIGKNGVELVGARPPGTATQSRVFPLLWGAVKDNYDPAAAAQFIVNVAAAIGGYSQFLITDVAGSAEAVLTTQISGGSTELVKDTASLLDDQLKSTRVLTVTQNSVTATLTGDVTQVTNPNGTWTLTGDSLIIPTVAGDPTASAALVNRAEWYNSSTNRFRVRQNGTTRSLVTNDTTADDLTQYALLAGRSGGQTLKGGTAASENLTLESTNHATKGSILFGATGGTYYDQANGILTIGQNAYVGDAVLQVSRSNQTLASGNGTAVLYTTTAQAADIGPQLTFAGNDGTFGDRTFAAIAGRKENGTSGNYASYLEFATRPNGGSLTRALLIDSAQGLTIGKTGGNVGFYGSPGGARTTQGAGVTNNVTSGGTANTIPNFTDLTTYANDAAAIRNGIYQLAVLMTTVVGCLRTVNLMS